jgi:aspartyl-tRNA(Asn)/glutamyl-tRNA(Gln) amidotransferase subunit A
MDAALVHFGSIMGPSMAELAAPDDERFMGYARDFLAKSAAGFARSNVYAGINGEAAIHRAIAEVFVDHDVLITPTIGGYGFLAGEEYTDGIEVAGRWLDFYLLACLTPVFNVASRHPVLNVPSGLGPNGVPTGVQVVARPYDDVTAFHAGAAAERELGIWNDPSWRPSL